MFKKLKQKINEEQSPQRNAQSPQQAQVGPGERRSSHSPSLHQDAPASPSDRESGSKGVMRSHRGSINGDGSASPQREEPQSFAQKLQLKVPSVESLLRGASRAEGLFRSPSKESLVRSSSRDSLTALGENDPPATPAYDPPSDIESEAEESPSHADSLSKDQLLHRLHRVEKSLGNYRGKYSELVIAYRTVQRDKEKTQAILSQSQDKSLRRIGELREELQMDQQAKKHLQEEFDATLEEKDQRITVLQTQVALMKKRLKEVPGSVVLPEGGIPQSEDAADSSSVPQSPSKDPGAETSINEAEGSSDPGKVVELLQQRVKRQENLLQKCKELLRTHKERSMQLGSENETLQQQLQERLQELEKIKELHTTEKTKLITQLRDAKNLIEQLEQDKGMVIAETKRQMHETLEMKEEEIAQLRSRIKEAAVQREELQEQKEKSEKSAFEELERALGMAQRAEEARRQLQVQLDEQVKEVEKASEEERKSLQHELTRVKQEVVTIMKKSSEDKVAEMDRLHREALTSKEEELSARISQAVEQCKEELAQAAKEREQQAALALEDAELQKAALEAVAENSAKEIRLELETARTRILELESSVEKNSEARSGQSDELSHQMEDMKTTHKEEITAREETHREQLEKHKLKRDVLAQQHNTAIEELKKKHRDEVETILKEKELQFHAHVEDMNQKTMEKLDLKQTELEALSSELSEVLKCKQIFEEKLAAAEDAGGSARQELEQKLQHELTKHSVEIEDIRLQHEQSLGGMEKTLKEELNKLKMVLKEKERELEERSLREKSIEEESETVLQDRNAKVKELEVLQHSLMQAQSEKEGLEQSNVHLSKISDELSQCKSELKDLEQQLQQAKKDFSEQEKSYTKELNTKQEKEKQLNKQLDDLKAAHDKKIENTKKEMEGKLKAQETKMDKIKHKAKEMQEKFKKRLQEQEESSKNELAKKEKELQEKEQQVKDNMMAMAQTNSEGLSSTLSELQANHKGELEKLRQVCKQEQEELERHWKETLGQQEEDMQEKHTHMLQQKAQEVEEVAQQLSTTREEKEQVLQEVKNLREELAMRETTVHKLQAELKEAAVKLESLSQAEAILKEQVEAVEKNLSQALNERNSFQDRLSKVEEESRAKLKAQTDKFEETEKKLQIAISNQLKHYCQEIQAKMDGGTNELCERVEGRVRELKDRVLCNQKKVAHLKNIILTKVDRIRTLEEQLLQRSVENQNLCSSLEQMNAQLDVYTENIKALTAEKESLQRDAESQSQALSEKVICIEKLSEDNKTISENVKTNALHISNLESIINDLKTQLASSLTGKNEAISLLDQQHKEKRERLVSQMEETIERLDKEKTSAVEQADTLRNNLSEFKRKAESKFTQNHNTVKSLQARIEDMERQVADKDEALQRLTTGIDNQSISKSEMDQVLSEKEQKISALTLEMERCNVRVIEMEEQLSLKTNECEQLITDLKQQHSIMDNEKRELTERLQQTNEQFTQNGNLVRETEEKLQSLEKENQTSKQELVRQREDFEKIKAGMFKSKEDSLKAAEERMSAESAGKVAELKKKAEQKIGQIRKQLTSHLEEKDQTINVIQTQLGEMKESEAMMKQHMGTLEEKCKTLEEIVAKLKEEQEKHLEQVRSDERLEKECSLESLKDMYEEKLSTLQREVLKQEETKADEALSRLSEVEKKLKETEEQNENHLAEISSLKVDLLEKTALVVEQKTAIACFEKQGQSPVNLENAIEMEHCTAEQAESNIGKEMENHSLKEEEMDIESSMSLQNKLKEAVNEKQKLQKDFTRLQKDLRSLRKEHEQDLEYIKKELTGENEKKLKLELEDMEMKHNSGLKQLMREFNTQMALKEQELDAVIKETIGKAQSVEAELMNSHREEANQLQKVIAQKDDDLNRTVQRYEQVLQTREDEMGDRVWQVQKELEDLQTRSHSNSQMGVEELQAQLAERTTLLSEARLKEQQFVDRIHSLEDKIRCVNKNSVVTHLGSTFKDPGHYSADAFSEPTEFEYLRKVLFEYMMGRETKTMAKVITSMLKFPPDQAEKVLEKEDSKAVPWLR